MLKKFKLALVFVLALVMCSAGIPAAFAADQGAIIGSEAHPAQAAVTKILEMPVGTTTPETEFKFLVNKVSVDNETKQEIVDTMPDLENLSIPFTAANTGMSSGDVKTVILQTSDIFSGVDWKHAGVYVYELTEDATTFIDKNVFPGPDSEKMIFSGAKYTLNVYVKASTTTPGAFYVYAVGALVTTTDNNGQTQGTKVDPTPGTDGKYSKMTFTNTYLKVNGGTDPLTDGTLSVSKKVAGEFADDSWFFDFSITLYPNSLVPSDIVPEYKRGYVVENGVVIDPVNNADAGLIDEDGAGKYIKISIGGPTAFQLKSNQKLVFIDTPVGITYDVQETAVLEYTTSANVITSGNAVNAPAPSDPNADFVILNQHVGDGTNSADFTNTRNEVSFTGISMANLPFVGMIALAVAALVAFAVAKLRKRTSGARA